MEHFVSFNDFLEHDFTHANESHQTSSLTDAQINLEQKQQTNPGCIDNKYLQSIFFGKVEEISTEWIWVEILKNTKHGYHTL